MTHEEMLKNSTPRPWKKCSMFPDADGYKIGREGRKLVIASVKNQGSTIAGEARANFEVTVRAVNSYEALLNALQLLISRLHECGNWEDGCFYYNRVSASELESPLGIAEAALALAKGEA